MLGDHMNTDWSHQGWASYKLQKSCWERIKICFPTRGELLVLVLCSCCLATNIRLYWAQENNVQRLSTSHACFFHMENELISKASIFLSFFLVLGIPSDFSRSICCFVSAQREQVKWRSPRDESPICVPGIHTGGPRPAS